jgi:hypothetical protein
MDDFVPFAGGFYFAMLGLLVFARTMDFLSTWIATPNLVLEGNPIVKKLGWKLSIPLNMAICIGFAMWPFVAVIFSTTSVLVAARNFQGAWLMRTLGEASYREWQVARVREVRLSLYLFCLFAQTILTTAVGLAVFLWSAPRLVPMAIGFGIIGYAAAITFYALLSVWRIRRTVS